MSEIIGAAEHASVPATTAPESQLSNPPKQVHPLLKDASCVLGNDGQAYILVKQGPATIALRSGGNQFNNYVHEQARLLNQPMPRRADLAELDYLVRSVAETTRTRQDIWLRAASIPEGVEIDLGDHTHRRVRITAKGMEVLERSDSVFQRTPHMKAIPAPSGAGNPKALFRYLPQDPVASMMVLAFITYVIAHPKREDVKYVILSLTGSSGSGKSFLSKLIQKLVDPTAVTAQTFPTKPKDLAIAIKSAHLAVFDNIRSLPPLMADALCIAATGGSMTSRQLYTDDEQQLIRLHGAIVLNGIPAFVDQPDLAQRCLRVQLPKRQKGEFGDEQEMAAQLDAETPEILGSLYGLIAEILGCLPQVSVRFPHRMVSFVRWLGAIEMVTGRKDLQEAFTMLQAEAQRDALQENPFAAAVLEFAENEKSWTGTPTVLLHLLNNRVSESTQRSRDWPANPSSLTKRLTPLDVALREQGIDLVIHRGTERQITITNERAY